MSHGQVFLTDREDLGDLLWSPDGEVAQSEAGTVKYVGEAPDLVLLVLQQALKDFYLNLCVRWLDDRCRQEQGVGWWAAWAG